MSISTSLRIFRICCPLDEYQCPLTIQTLSKLLNSISSIEALKVLNTVFKFVTTVLHLVFALEYNSWRIRVILDDKVAWYDLF